MRTDEILPIAAFPLERTNCGEIVLTASFLIVVVISGEIVLSVFFPMVSAGGFLLIFFFPMEIFGEIPLVAVEVEDCGCRHSEKGSQIGLPYLQSDFPYHAPFRN